MCIYKYYSEKFQTWNIGDPIQNCGISLDRNTENLDAEEGSAYLLWTNTHNEKQMEEHIRYKESNKYRK